MASMKKKTKHLGNKTLQNHDQPRLITDHPSIAASDQKLWLYYFMLYKAT